MRPHDHVALADAEEFLTRARSALQLETGKRSDRLLLELQPSIARSMGFTDEPSLIAEDGLMRAVFEHARTVRWISSRVFDLLAAEHTIRHRSNRCKDPAAVLATLADAAERGDRPGAALLDALEHATVPDPVEWTGPVA